MTRPLNQGQGELLRLLAQMPFLDRLEMASLAVRSRGGVYEAVGRLEDAGLIASVSHGTPLLAPTSRYYLTEGGVNALALGEAQPVNQLLPEYPLSLRWRRILLERLDAAAVIYRLALADLGHPVRFRWRRALPQDADVVLPEGRVLAIVRQGATAERAVFAKRLWRLAPCPRPGAFLVMVPDEVRQRQTVVMLREALPAASLVPAFFALERHAAAASAADPIWRSSAGAALSLSEAVGRANPGGVMAAEPPLVRISVPRDIELRDIELNGGGAQRTRSPDAGPAASRRKARPGPAGRLALAGAGRPCRAPGREPTQGVPDNRRPGTPGAGRRRKARCPPLGPHR